MENPFLEESRLLSQKGKSISTAVHGCQLEDILRQHDNFQRNISKLILWSHKLGPQLAMELQSIIIDEMGFPRFTSSALLESSRPENFISRRSLARVKSNKVKHFEANIPVKPSMREAGVMTQEQFSSSAHVQTSSLFTTAAPTSVQMSSSAGVVLTPHTQPVIFGHPDAAYSVSTTPLVFHTSTPPCSLPPPSSGLFSGGDFGDFQAVEVVANQPAEAAPASSSTLTAPNTARSSGSAGDGQSRKWRKKRSPRRKNVADNQYATPMPMSNEAVEVECLVDSMMSKADTIAANISNLIGGSDGASLMPTNHHQSEEIKDPFEEFLSSLEKQVEKSQLSTQDNIDLFDRILRDNPPTENSGPNFQASPERSLQTPPLREPASCDTAALSSNDASETNFLQSSAQTPNVPSSSAPKKSLTETLPRIFSAEVQTGFPPAEDTQHPLPSSEEKESETSQLLSETPTKKETFSALLPASPQQSDQLPTQEEFPEAPVALQLPQPSSADENIPPQPPEGLPEIPQPQTPQKSNAVEEMSSASAQEESREPSGPCETQPPATDRQSDEGITMKVLSSEKSQENPNSLSRDSPPSEAIQQTGRAAPNDKEPLVVAKATRRPSRVPKRFMSDAEEAETTPAKRRRASTRRDDGEGAGQARKEAKGDGSVGGPRRKVGRPRKSNMVVEKKEVERKVGRPRSKKGDKKPLAAVERAEGSQEKSTESRRRSERQKTTTTPSGKMMRFPSWFSPPRSPSHEEESSARTHSTPQPQIEVRTASQSKGKEKSQPRHQQKSGYPPPPKFRPDVRPESQPKVNQEHQPECRQVSESQLQVGTLPEVQREDPPKLHSKSKKFVPKLQPKSQAELGPETHVESELEVKEKNPLKSRSQVKPAQKLAPKPEENAQTETQLEIERGTEAEPEQEPQEKHQSMIQQETEVEIKEVPTTEEPQMQMRTELESEPHVETEAEPREKTVTVEISLLNSVALEKPGEDPCPQTKSVTKHERKRVKEKRWVVDLDESSEEEEEQEGMDALSLDSDKTVAMIEAQNETQIDETMDMDPKLSMNTELDSSSSAANNSEFDSQNNTSDVLIGITDCDGASQETIPVHEEVLKVSQLVAAVTSPIVSVDSEAVSVSVDNATSEKVPNDQFLLRRYENASLQETPENSNIESSIKWNAPLKQIAGTPESGALRVIVPMSNAASVPFALDEKTSCPKVKDQESSYPHFSLRRCDRVSVQESGETQTNVDISQSSEICSTPERESGKQLQKEVSSPLEKASQVKESLVDWLNRTDAALTDQVNFRSAALPSTQDQQVFVAESPPSAAHPPAVSPVVRMEAREELDVGEAELGAEESGRSGLLTPKSARLMAEKAEELVQMLTPSTSALEPQVLPVVKSEDASEFPSGPCPNTDTENQETKDLATVEEKTPHSQTEAATADVDSSEQNPEDKMSQQSDGPMEETKEEAKKSESRDPFFRMAQSIQQLGTGKPTSSSGERSEGNPLVKMNIGNFLSSLYQK